MTNPSLRRFTASLAALVLAVAAIGAVTAACADQLRIVGWRLPSSIVLRGSPIAGTNRLREDEMKGSTATELDAVDADQDDDAPTPSARLIVSALAQMDAGRIELKDGRLSIVAVADAKKVDELSSRIRANLPSDVVIAELRVDPPERAPFHWSATKGWDDDVGDAASVATTLSGEVADARSRGRLVAAASKRGSPVVDRMRERMGAPPEFSAAAEALLAQLRVMTSGFVWIYGQKVDLVGTSIGKASGDRAGCRTLATVLPQGVECGVVRLEATRRHSKWGQGYSYERHSEATPAPSTQFVAARPAEPDAVAAAKGSDPRRVDILYATLRRRSEAGEETPGIVRYSGERSEQLDFGWARVSVPKGHKMGQLELPRTYSLFGIKLWSRDGFVVRGAKPLTQEEWDSLIDEMGPNEALVFVHGFHNSFNDALLHFAQISVDLQYTKGLRVLFSWASRGGVADYIYDRNSALLARDAFLQVLDDLQTKHNISKVHVIAHSMGNYVVLDALANRSGARPRLGQLIMAAPDVDNNEFTQDLPKVRNMFDGLTLYASSNDYALAASMHLAGGVPRAGYCPAPPGAPVVLPGLDTLDVSALEGNMFDWLHVAFDWHHNAFSTKRPLIDDIGLILKDGNRPPRFVEQIPAPEGAAPPRWWRFAP